MKKTAILFLLILPVLKMYSGDTLRLRKSNRFLLGVTVSSYNFKSSFYGRDQSWVYNEGPAVRMGLEAKIKLNNYVYFSPGFYFADFKSSMYVRDDHSVAGPITYKHEFMVRSFQVPLKFDFILTNKKISPLIVAGFNPEYFIQMRHKTTTIFGDGTTHEQQFKYSVPRSTLFPSRTYITMGAGINVNLKKISLQAYPTYEFSIMRTPVKSGSYYFNRRIGGVVSAFYKF
ncbi:MAG: hypothetical protein K0S32_3535 [Bacteroidetes bacterium]|jgi:hypothetical protein|nr:hypothetical protein [Bacteroidota bacterium]